MKKLFFVFLLTSYSCVTQASHITGGEMIYEYVGPGSQANSRTFKITLKLFRDQHTTGAPMPPNVFIGIFNNDTKNQFPSNAQPFTVELNNETPVNIDAYPPCVSNAPDLDYHVGYYSLTVELPDNSTGYTVSYQTCCRVNPLVNVYNSIGNGGTGSTYSTVIPSLNDSSPAFAGSIDLICNNRDFTLNFGASDADGDSLVYYFAEAYGGGAAVNANNINPAAPPYNSVSYVNNYSSDSPLGKQATINSATGVISGVAPAAGKYVVSVAVKSYRKRKLIGEHRKDFIVNVGNCDLPGAELKLRPVACHDYSVNFNNDNPSSLNKTFYWNFGDPKSGAANTSELSNPVHVYSDTGVFVYTLVINKGQPCSDSAKQTIKVYPGFVPNFTSFGQCINGPVQFSDATVSKYGKVNSWSWNFGDGQNSADTSHAKNPSYKYSVANNYNVQLTVSDNKGCTDTISSSVIMNDKAAFTITNDTLICTIDTLQLNVSGNGTVLWTPNYNISSQTSSSPLISPDIPTKYYANFSDIYGCKGTDSVFVDVKSFVTLYAGNDTSICGTDAIVLSPLSDALQYKWTPSAGLDNDAAKQPVATPLTTTLYSVTGSIGKCQSSDDIIIKVSPYPVANAGQDSSICKGNSVQLFATGGSIYKWSPPFFLNNANTANPVATPVNDMLYVVTVSDTLGCPKAVSDSVFINVINVVADAGPADTSIVVDQPLQLNATGGEFYVWAPATGLSNNNINNPVARLSNSQKYTVIVTDQGCTGTDSINVTVYKVKPDIYVPNAFTPNNDNINDVFRPIAIGLKSINYFRVYDRWGKLVFSTYSIGKGWDGKYLGKMQDGGIYVWMAEGIDYLDKKFSRKGVVELIR